MLLITFGLQSETVPDLEHCPGRTCGMSNKEKGLTITVARQITING